VSAAMNIKQLALILGAATLVASGGIGAVACSSSSGNGSSSSSSGGGSGSSSGSTMDSGGNTDTGTNEDSGSSSGGDAGSGVDCGKLPSLHPNPAGDVYCGYGPGDSGVTIDCVADSGMGWCCLGGGDKSSGYAPQICAGNAQGCLADTVIMDGGYNGIPIQCNQISDCPGNGAPGATACCLQGSSAATMVAGCGYDKATSGNAIMCEGDGGGTTATACQAGEVQICSTQADCPSGTTCQAGKWKIYQIGFCL
jgi:hypothetical protein